MTILDSNIVIRRTKAGDEVFDDITGITQVEYPPILEYDRFCGEIVYPSEQDIDLAGSIQAKLRKIGKPQTAQDLIIAAICINRDELLITTDDDFEDISSVSNLTPPKQHMT